MNNPISIKEAKFGMLVIPGQAESPLPLEASHIAVHLTGMIAVLKINQDFSNPFSDPVEMEYLFPLPEQAAILDFAIHIGTRLIRGEIQEAERAQEAYEQARSEGRLAAMVDQRRPDLFAVRIANVQPGEKIQTTIELEDRLTLRPGELEFVLPMGLTPRYTSPDHLEEARGIHHPVALPGETIGRVIIELTADLGFSARTPVSPSHLIEVEQLEEGKFTLHLAGDTIPDHDFILRIPLPGNPFEVVAWSAKTHGAEFLLATWLPAAVDSNPAKLLPRDMVFILDRSGSMSGEPIRQARNALRACLRILEPQDTFRILLFDDRLEWFQEIPTATTQANIDQADSYLSVVEGRGGTEIVEALEATLNLPSIEGRRKTIVLLTDGAVSSEERAQDLIRRKLGNARLFTFGIGPSVNRTLLSKMALLGRGAAEFLQLDEDIEGAILRFQDTIAFPVLTDIKLEWSGCKTWDTYPAILPDLFAGQALQLVTRLQRKSGAKAILHVTGKRGQQTYQFEMPLPAPQEIPEISRVWARARIEDLLEQGAANSSPAHLVRQEVISLALEHHLVTHYTSFIALDSAIVNPSGKPFPIAISQPLPKGLERSGFFPQSINIGAPPPAAAAPTGMRALFQTAAHFLKENQPGVNSQAASSQPPLAGFLATNSLIQSEPLTPTRHTIANRDEVPTYQGIPEDVERTLRWLARIQKLDGSWSAGVEFCAAALLAFTRHGHTVRQGHYRKQVAKAANWLVGAQTSGTDIFSQVLAIFEFNQANPGHFTPTQVQDLYGRLPQATTAFESAVFGRVTYVNLHVTSPEKANSFDDLRTLVALHEKEVTSLELISSDPTGLAQIWAISLLG